jgi:hypothetical protein
MTSLSHSVARPAPPLPLLARRLQAVAMLGGEYPRNGPARQLELMPY